MLGLPSGLNEAQWIENMEAEHCDVDPGEAESPQWGGSDRPWVTGNYLLETTPKKEWRFAWSATCQITTVSFPHS